MQKPLTVTQTDRQTDGFSALYSRLLLLLYVTKQHYHTTNAPINIMPHYPLLGNVWGTQGNLTQF